MVPLQTYVDSVNSEYETLVLILGRAEMFALVYALEVQVKELMDAKERIGMLEDVLDHRDHTIKSLQHKLGQIQTEGKSAGKQYLITSEVLSHVDSQVSLATENEVLVLIAPFLGSPPT